MEQYTVTGMSCAACSARVEKAVSHVPGVTSCLLTNSMGVEGTASPQEIIAAVEQAGYGASVKGAANETSSSSAAAEEALADHETPVLKRRLIASIGFLIVLMYFSMGHMMWNWPLPAWFENNHIAVGLVQLLLAASLAPRSQYGHTGCHGIHGVLCLERLRALRHDRSAVGGKFRRRDGIYA